MIFNNTANTYKEYELGVVGEPQSDTEDKTKVTLRFSIILTGAHAHVHVHSFYIMHTYIIINNSSTA